MVRKDGSSSSTAALLESDPELAEACRLLGITAYDPPLPPPREAKVIGGNACLVFTSPAARQQAVNACKIEVTSRCAQGARAGCSLQAMDKCRGPRLLRWLGFNKQRGYSLGQRKACGYPAMQYVDGSSQTETCMVLLHADVCHAGEDVSACEEQFMQGCMDVAQEGCRKHAMDFCETALPMQLCSPQPYSQISTDASSTTAMRHLASSSADLADAGCRVDQKGHGCSNEEDA